MGFNWPKFWRNTIEQQSPLIVSVIDGGGGGKTDVEIGIPGTLVWCLPLVTISGRNFAWSSTSAAVVKLDSLSNPGIWMYPQFNNDLTAAVARAGDGNAIGQFPDMRYPIGIEAPFTRLYVSVGAGFSVLLIGRNIGMASQGASLGRFVHNLNLEL